MKELLFLNPIFKERLWGGTRLKTEYHYNISTEHTGECWAISAHPEGDCTVANGSFKGIRLSELWNTHKELFGYVSGQQFPLLVKIIDAKEDLSIQVHPDDAYAKANEEGACGKTECWYILDCTATGSIIIGHHANSKEELRQMIEEGHYDELLNSVAIHKGDFLQIPPGTLHSIKAGTLLLETQQNCDITYRVYDYNRVQNGKPRELQVQKSLDVITCPYQAVVPQHHLSRTESYDLEELIHCDCYTVKRLMLHGKAEFAQRKPFFLCSVTEGCGTLDGVNLTKGSHFIIPYDYGSFQLAGNLEMIVSNT